MQLCNFAHNVFSQKKTMFKVSNRIMRKRCLLISKITVKTSERRHLITSYLPEVTVQNHVLDRFSLNIYKFVIKFWRPLISTIVHPYVLCYEKWEITTEIFDSWKFQNVSIFYFWKNSPKMDKFFNFLSYIQRVVISVSQS